MKNTFTLIDKQPYDSKLKNMCCRSFGRVLADGGVDEGAIVYRTFDGTIIEICPSIGVWNEIPDHYMVQTLTDVEVNILGRFI